VIDWHRLHLPLRGAVLFAGLLLLAGCEPEGPSLVVDPPSAPLSGYLQVSIELPEEGPAAADVVQVVFGFNRAYQLTVVDDRTVTGIIQGHPTAGEVDVTVETAAETHVFEGAFLYEGPLDPAFERLVTIGASFTQGVQSAVPTDHAILNSPAALIAKQSQAYLSLPQFKPGLFPPMTIDDIGDPPDCVVPGVTQYISWAMSSTLTQMVDPDTGEFGFQWGREDPDIEVWNLGVGSFTIREVAEGPDPDDSVQQFLAHLVYDPYGGIFDSVPSGPLPIVAELDPTIVVAVDFVGNNVVTPMLQGNTINPDELISPEEFAGYLTSTLDQLEQTDAEIFIANLPDATILPAVAERKRFLLEQGWQTEEEIDAALAAVVVAADAFNAEMATQCAARDRVHLIDFDGEVRAINDAGGLEVGSATLTIHKFGGLVSYDGLHFTDVGYGLLANIALEVINAELGTDIPLVDLAAVHDTDPYSSMAMIEAGLDPAECDPLSL
jgi:GDSL-like Lipase/Acylhydrolase